MSMPPRPLDIQLASIIDKLAQFVARNGPDFEKMTADKQQNNTKFKFLRHGEEYNDYYQYRLMEERRNLLVNLHQPQNNFQQTTNPIWSNNNSNGTPQPQQPQQIPQVSNINLTPQIEAINVQQIKLREQIIQSEKNLQAQHQVLLQQQKSQIEEAIANAQLEHITRCAQENQISLTELDEILQPIIESCTKDSIANGKASILQQATNSAKRQIISQYILKKAMATNAGFTQKLHLIYLINDLLHHCVKKNADDLKNCLESVVIPMFCNATISANDEQKDKLGKLLNLWASKANFFDSCAISKLQSPPSSIQEYQNSLLSQYASAITPLTQATKDKFDNYQQQHQAFIQHASNQITILETQKQKLEQQNLQQPPPLLTDLTQNPQIIPSILNNVNMLINQNRNNEVNLLQNLQNFQNQQQHQQQQQQQQQQQNHNFSTPQDFIQQSNNQFQNFNLPPPNFSVPDFSRPPPGFNNSAAESTPPMTIEPQEEINLTPTLPFFELPAGLMAPLIRLEDCNYRSIDPDKLQIPPPTPPSEKLLSAVEAFYAPPSHERPRDNEGWEKLGLYEYFKIKNVVRKQKDEAVAKFEREKSRSPTPIPETLIKPAKRVKRRIYRSKSPEKRSKSRSASPEIPKVTVKPRERPIKRKSPIKRSPSPVYRNFNREPRNQERNRKRSVTPPSFAPAVNKTTDFLDEGNKGHQMLKKLGWQSGGLGAGNQGITQPISGGEIRDRNDMYKGVGMNTNDPYENFRKNRSNNFITRMKTRSEVEKN